MTVYPLPTMACTIGPDGITAPPYSDILGNLQYLYQQIYGTDTDLDSDTQDGQYLAIIAQGINDTNAATIVAFNARSPSTAQGVGLSSVVKINGLTREEQTNSTAPITVVGQTGTQLNNCLIGDNQGLNTQWSIPNFTQIPDAGFVIVTATCTTPGAITAADNTLTQILTPTLGWQTANNAEAASPGQPVEDDAELRQRQSTSQNQAAQSPADACQAALAALPGVTAVTYDENVSGTTNANGTPGHAICFVVGGGNVVSIAQTILTKKTIGTQTYGTTTENVVDAGGRIVPISFDILTNDEITVALTIKALTGYVSTTAAAIQAAVSAYISGLPIGAVVSFSRVNAIASLMTSPLNSTFELIDADTLLNGSAADVTVPFNEQPYTQVSDVSVTVGM